MHSTPLYFKPWFRTLVIVVSILAAVKAYDAFTKVSKRSKRGFSIEKIAPHKESLLVAPSISHEQLAAVNAILQQPFFFLDHGKQCFAFESDDEKWVLKFFKHGNHLSEIDAAHLGKGEKIQESQEKYERLLKSFELAVTALPDETGIVFYHFAKTEDLHPESMLLDRRGKVVHVPMDEVHFVLQRRAKCVKPVLIRLMHEGKTAEAKKRIDQIFALLITMSRKGIQDRDGALIRNDNIGFLEDRAIFIDTGKFSLSKKQLTRADVEHDMRRVRPLANWLQKNYPDLSLHFEDAQQHALEQFS